MCESIELQISFEMVNEKDRVEDDFVEPRSLSEGKEENGGRRNQQKLFA